MPLVHLMVSDDAMRCVDSEAVVFTSKGKSQLLITSITDALLRVTSTLPSIKSAVSSPLTHTHTLSLGSVLCVCKVTENSPVMLSGADAGTLRLTSAK